MVFYVGILSVLSKFKRTYVARVIIHYFILNVVVLLIQCESISRMQSYLLYAPIHHIRLVVNIGPLDGQYQPPTIDQHQAPEG